MGAPVTAEPHDGQKRAPGTILAPQVGQAAIRGAPQVMQNLEASRFSVRQVGQNTLT